MSWATNIQSFICLDWDKKFRELCALANISIVRRLSQLSKPFSTKCHYPGRKNSLLINIPKEIVFNRYHSFTLVNYVFNFRFQRCVATFVSGTPNPEYFGTEDAESVPPNNFYVSEDDVLKEGR